VAENLGYHTCGVGACVSTVPLCMDRVPNAGVPRPPGSEGLLGNATRGDGIDDDSYGAVDAPVLDCPWAVLRTATEEGEKVGRRTLQF